MQASNFNVTRYNFGVPMLDKITSTANVDISKPFEARVGTLSHRYLRRLEKTDWFKDKHCDCFFVNLSHIFLRCMAALAAVVVAAADLAWWTLRTIAIIPVCRQGFKNHFAEFISTIAQPILALNIPCGYLPIRPGLVKVPLASDSILLELKEKRASLNANQRKALDKKLLDEFRSFLKPRNIIKLIMQGANVNVKDKFGRTPLVLAFAHCFVEEARILIHYGATVDDSTSLYFLYRLPAIAHIHDLSTLETRRLSTRKVEAAAKLLVAHGVKFDQKELNRLHGYSEAILTNDKAKYKKLSEEENQLGITSPLKKLNILEKYKFSDDYRSSYSRNLKTTLEAVHNAKSEHAMAKGAVDRFGPSPVDG